MRRDALAPGRGCENRLMFLRAVDWLFRHTLCSVPFGIALLASIAAYIAVGSGLASVREYFELDELGFFNAWPLKLMMVLMVVTLITVTIQRIPLTPPRYGVWCVHVGIVTLIAGAAWYYKFKVEGAILIPTGGAATRFYDRWERALYLQAGGFVTRVPLTSLPRFASYSDELKNASYLDRGDLRDLSPMLIKPGEPGTSPVPAPAAEALGLKELKFAITGYWPYADIRTRLAQDPLSLSTGFVVRTPPHGNEPEQENILVGDEMRYRQFSLGTIDFEQRSADRATVEGAIAASKKLHTLAIKTAGYDKTMNVQVGETVTLDATGITLQFESFEADFPAMDGSRVQLLTMMVRTPTQTFRRQVISGREKPTDWKLGEAGAGPMGKRQTEPLDSNLITTYTFKDEQTLMPRGEALAKYTIFTTPGDTTKATVVGMSLNDPSSVQAIQGATAKLAVPHPLSGEDIMRAAMTGQAPHRHADEMTLVRVEQARAEQYVLEVPKHVRDKDEGQSGRKQVVRVRAEGLDHEGKPFKVDVLAPFSERPYEAPWTGGLLNVPGINAIAQLQLGNMARPLPARIKLDKFEAQAYGGFEATAAPMLRDFRSTITITDLQTGKSLTDTVFLNSPVKYDPSPLSAVFGKSWIFFQSGWDPEGQRFTILGIGNRPGVFAMTAGCVMIIVGIFYAFYIKPVIINRMKAKAIEAAKAKQGDRPTSDRGRAALAAR